MIARRRARPVLVSMLSALVTAAVLVALASGCASSAPSGFVIVRCRGLMFDPATITVTPGTTVRWINDDNTAHTTTSMGLVSAMPTTTVDRPTSWNSGPLSPGDHFDHKFTAAGTFPYQCMVHNYMEGTVTVQPK